MAFDDRSFQPERHQLVFSNDAGMVESGVEGRAGVSLGEDNSVVEEVFGVFGMELHTFWVEEHGSDDVGNGGGGSGMASFGDMHASSTVDSDLVAHILPEREVLVFHLVERYFINPFQSYLLITALFIP